MKHMCVQSSHKLKYENEKGIVNSLPSDVILGCLRDQSNSFQYIRYIIDPSLLNAQSFSSLVEIQDSVR